MKLPKHIKVGVRQYHIVYPYVFNERGDRWGHCDFANEEIVIKGVDAGGRTISDKTVLAVLIHEVIHAIDLGLGYRLFDDNERACEGIAEGMMQVLTENPEFTKLFLTEVRHAKKKRKRKDFPAIKPKSGGTR